MTNAAMITEPDRGSLVPALLIAVFALAIGATAAYAPPRTGEMAVVFAPGTAEQNVFAAILAARGRFVAPTRFDNIVVAYALDPGFAGRVQAFGGLITLAAHGLCTPEPIVKE